MNTTSDQSPLTKRLELSATILLIVVLLLVGGVIVWDRLNPQPAQAARREPAPPKDPVSIDGAPILGDRNARVGLILFSEFECPFCGQSAREVLPDIERQYLRTGKVFLAWRHYPLSIHEYAKKAAEAAECAGRQGKFWEYHDWAFQHQKALDEPNLRAAAKDLRLDLATFGTCLEGQASAKVQADRDLGKSLSVNATPTWFIGLVQPDGKLKLTNRLSGAQPFTDFQIVIDKVIATVDDSKK